MSIQTTAVVRSRGLVSSSQDWPLRLPLPPLPLLLQTTAVRSRGLVSSGQDSFLEAMSDANMIGGGGGGRRPWQVSLRGGAGR